MALAGGVIGTSGCVEINVPGDEDVGGNAGTATDSGGDDPSTADGSNDADSIDDDPMEDQPADTDEDFPRTVRIHDFELSSTMGELSVYGSVKARGIYDPGGGEDLVYVSPSGRTDWEIWSLEDEAAIPMDDDDPADINADAIIEFPSVAVAAIEETEPFLIIRADIGRYHEDDSNEFLGWNSTRVHFTEGPDEVFGEHEFVISEANDIWMTFRVAPLPD